MNPPLWITLPAWVLETATAQELADRARRLFPDCLGVKILTEPETR